MSIRQEIELFLNGQQIDLNDNGGIYFNYKQKDIKNPTIVKNSFSKTLTVPGTGNNNNIFNNIWNLNRAQTTDIVPYFNQSKRVPFELFLNGELIEKGYCKLDMIRTDKVNEYDLSLYGGLGDFFYGLSYNVSSGEKLSLADLDFGFSSITVSKETIKDGWDKLEAGSAVTITFAPTYNGLPDIIDTNKVLVNTNGYTGHMMMNTGGSVWSEVTGFPTSVGSYSTYQGYGLVELPEPLTSAKLRDIRSYLQTPVLSVKSLFTAISNPEINGGYNVVLDEDFFVDENAYYSKAFITLPSVTELKPDNVEEEPINVTVDGNSGWSKDVTTIALGMDSTTGRKKDGMDITLNLIARLRDGSTANTLYTSCSIRDRDYKGLYYGGFACQIVGVDSRGHEVAGSNIVWVTTELGAGDFKTMPEMTKFLGQSSFHYYDQIVNSIGLFNKSGDVYVWSQPLNFKILSTTEVKSYRLKIVPGAYSEKNSLLDYAGTLWEVLGTSPSSANRYNAGPSFFNIDITEAYKLNSSSPGSYSGAKLSKEDLLKTNYTPADYLLSYCKLFNLYFDKDVEKNTIRILTSKNFYDKTVDLTDDIDRSREINPLSFSHKWYSFNYRQNKTTVLDDYKAKYGTDFGQQRVNTGYEFDSDTEELLTNNIFLNAAQVLEADRHYVKMTNNNQDVPTFLTDVVTYNLYGTNNENQEIKLMKAASTSTTDINGKSQEEIKYDAISKVQLHSEEKPVDGSNVLLFYNGHKATVDYWITDDVSTMQTLNGKPTWIYTANEYDAGGNKIAIRTDKLPQFSRYIDDDTNIYASWDFGRTREIYIPEIQYLEGDSTIYERYWRAYINDLYDVDTRIVTAYIRFEEKPTKESLKHFYYFDESYWVIDEIIDYCPTGYQLTKVRFVKVNDVSNYQNINVIPPIPEPKVVRIAFTSISWVNDVPYGGGTADKNNCSYTVTAYYSDGSNEDITSQATITGSQEVAETSDTNRHTAGTLTLVASYEDFTDSASVTIYQQGAPQYVITSITLDNLTWVTDVPAGGGTASYNNCSYTVTAHYNDGTSGDITGLAEMTGQEYIAGSTLTERHSVGTLTVWALYGDFSDSDTVTMYQAAANTYVELTTNPTIDATATTISYSVNASHPVTVKIDSAALPQPSYNTHPAGTSTGTFTIPANQHTYAEYFNVDAYLTDTPTVIDYNLVEQMGTHTPIYVNSPLTFKILTGGTINWMHNRTLLSDVGDLTIQYRLNGGSWTDITASTAGTSFNVSAGDIVEFKGNNSRYGSLPLSYNSFSGSTAYFEAYGNTMSMIYDLNFATATTLSQQYVFNRLLAGTRITTAENLVLPATTLPYHAYTSMFQGCSYMTKAPTLPAKTLSNSCYDEMFRDCISLNYIRCLATQLDTNSTYNWVNNVAPTGTFVKDPTMTSWAINSNNGVPIGWTLIDDLGTLTGITLENVSWVTDVPYTGGVASYQNCAYRVIGHYENGGTNDLTNLADMSYSTTLNVPATTATTRQSVGVVNVIATYYDGPNPFTATVVVTAYQEAVPTPNWTIYNPTSYNVYGNLLSGQSDYAGLEVLAGETESHYETVPATITNAYLVLSPASSSVQSITITNNRSGQSIACSWDSSASAYLGTGTINLAKDDTLRISVG